jgi:hypothetical protein
MRRHDSTPSRSTPAAAPVPGNIACGNRPGALLARAQRIQADVDAVARAVPAPLARVRAAR